MLKAQDQNASIVGVRVELAERRPHVILPYGRKRGASWILIFFEIYFFTFNYVYMCMSVVGRSTWMQCPPRLQTSDRLSWAAWCRCLDLSLSPQEKQYVLLTTVNKNSWEEAVSSCLWTTTTMTKPSWEEFLYRLMDQLEFQYSGEIGILWVQRLITLSWASCSLDSLSYSVSELTPRDNK